MEMTFILVDEFISHKFCALQCIDIERSKLTMTTLGTSRIGKDTTISSKFVFLLPDCVSDWLSGRDSPLDKPVEVSSSGKKR